MYQQIIVIVLLVCTCHAFASPFDVHMHASEQGSFEDIERALEQQFDTPATEVNNTETLISLASLYFQYERPDLLARTTDALAQANKDAGPLEHVIVTHFFNAIKYHLVHQYENAAKEYAFGLELLTHQDLEYPNGHQYLVTVFQIYQAANAGYLQDYSNSIEILSKLKTIADQNQWVFLSALCLYWLGDVSFELKHYEQAEQYFRQSKVMFANTSIHYAAKSQVREAQMMNIVGDRKQAFGLLNEATERLLQLDDKVTLAYTYLLQSYFHSKNFNHQAALEWIAKSVALREELGVRADIANAYVHYSAILGDNNQSARALEYGQKAAELVADTEDLAGQWDAFNNYAALLHAKGEYQQAYVYMSKSERALLAKARLDITQETARLMNQFEFQQQRLQNSFLDEKNTLLQRQLEQEKMMLDRQQLAITALSLFAVMILILLIVIYKLYLNNKRLAIKDPLTSLDNRRAILEQGERAFTMSNRHKQGLCVLMVDIDNFKTINDTHGHDVGDKALVLTASVLKSVLRSTDSVGRVGGEEFLIALPNCDEEQALLFVKRLFTALQQSLRASDLALKKLTVSVGLASNTPVYKNFIELAKSADIALYKAKKQGRNQVQVYRSEMTTTKT